MSTIQEIISRTNEAVIRSGTIHYERARKHNEGLIDVLTNAMGLRDPSLLEHSHNVSNLALKVARRLGLTQEQLDLIRGGSLYHDLGKLGIPQSILSKPGSLSSKEYEIVKTHPTLGVALLQECPNADPLISIVRHHHEFFNGQGYPDRISGNRIEIEARVVSVADAIDAMKTDRPYRRALTTKQITDELHKCANTQFDPIIVEPAIQILREMETEN